MSSHLGFNPESMRWNKSSLRHLQKATKLTLEIIKNINSTIFQIRETIIVTLIVCVQNTNNK